MSKSDDIDCQICEKRHNLNNCPMVKKNADMTLVFCEACGVHYTDKCPNHVAKKV